MRQTELLPNAADSSKSSAEYEIISTILERYKYDTKVPVVINENLEPCSAPTHGFLTADKLISRIDLETIYNDCTLKKGSDVDRSRLRRNLVLINGDDYKNVFKNRDCEIGWKAFYKKYPRSQGYVKFSRVGFDREMKFALVEFSYVKECLNGEGHFFLMKRDNDQWKIVDDAHLWMM